MNHTQPSFALNRPLTDSTPPETGVDDLGGWAGPLFFSTAILVTKPSDHRSFHCREEMVCSDIQTP
jgi:hypothetical protein